MLPIYPSRVPYHSQPCYCRRCRKIDGGAVVCLITAAWLTAQILAIVLASFDLP